MAKYDWKQLEKEYILSKYKTVTEFLRSKNIKSDGTTRRYTTGWKSKKRQKCDKSATKTIEKVIEKEAEKEAQQIADIKTIANDLALNIIKANSQLETCIVKNKKKTKTVEYDYKVSKPQKETIIENEEIETMNGIIDRQGLKMLTSALKDIKEILEDGNRENNEVEDLMPLAKLLGVDSND